MKYDDPILRTVLAGEYVLGTMTHSVRARFERLMRFDAGLARLVGDWADELGAIDRTAPSAVPSARVWRAIDALTRGEAAKPAKDVRSFWRPIALACAALSLVLMLALGRDMVMPTPPPRVMAVIADKDGAPGWIVTDDKAHAALTVTAVRDQPIDAQHAFELWSIAGGKPLPLGVIPARADQPITVPRSAVPATSVAFAVSLEPPGGSPTGLPTGPVLYQGKVLAD